MKGGCYGRLLWAAARCGCYGQETPRSASDASDASDASGFGGRKVHGTVRSQKIEMDGDGIVVCSSHKTTPTTTQTMPNYAESKRHKDLAKLFKAFALAKPETPEQKADREQRRAAFQALQLAKYGDPLAAYRAANPVPEMATGSPYQAAKEAWTNPENWKGALDHWTAAK